MTAPDGSRPTTSSEFGGPKLHGTAARVVEPQPSEPAAATSAAPAAPEPDLSGHWSSVGAAKDSPAAASAARVVTPSSARGADATTAIPVVPATPVVPAVPVATVAPSVPAAAAPSGPMPPVRPATAPPSGPGAAPRPPRAAKSTRGPRRARLQLRGISVWSALRFSVVLSIAMFCVWLVMVGVLYGILDGVGAISKVNEALLRIDPAGSAETVTPGMVFGGGVVIGAVYMVLFIAISTVGTLIYNLCADLVGGVELTLSEPE